MDWKQLLRWLAGGLLLGLFVSFALGPFIWQLITALKPAGQLAQLPPLLPAPPTAQHFVAVLGATGFLRVAANSLFVAVTTMLLAFILGVPAAYALAKLQVRGRQVILAALLCLSMFPAIANVAPLYLLFTHLGIRDSVFAVVITHSVFALPFTVWTLTNFFQEIPNDLYRAARIDGCSHGGILRHVVLPLAVPGLVSVGLLVFIFSWNEFLYAFTLTATERSRTLPVAIALFAGLHEIPWGEIAAAAILATIPTVVLVFLFQRRIISGLTAGAVKG
jgi:multiple sugar transport system permease protein